MRLNRQGNYISGGYGSPPPTFNIGNYEGGSSDLMAYLAEGSKDGGIISADQFRDYNDVYAGLHSFFQEDVRPFLEGTSKAADPAIQDNFRSYNDVDQGLHTFFQEDVLPHLMKGKDSDASIPKLRLGEMLNAMKKAAQNNSIQTDNFRNYNSVFQGLHTFFSDDVAEVIREFCKN